ncbi:uncharacterized protein LOC142175920 [Nicotiana tabacum]|uniref:Uncharacterized protein LOC142175920 n=1 Tax=Nicotiana tabacum TaxID=4097 RepID=A0AC58TPA4_TOBAC
MRETYLAVEGRRRSCSGAASPMSVAGDGSGGLGGGRERGGLSAAMTTTLMLALPNFGAEFVIETYACGMGIGAVLMQQGHPLAHMSKLEDPCMTTLVAQAYMENVYKLHGIPQTIISDRDVVFLSKFYQSLFEKPPTHMPYVTYSSLVEEVDKSLQARESTIRLLKHHLQLAQSRMKSHADKERSFREFAMGDMVFVRLQPYRQMSLKGQSYHKMSPKYFGLFLVIKRIGFVAYQLDLPAHAKIHSTLYVSQLKKHIGVGTLVAELLVALSPHGYIVLESESILESRVVPKGSRIVTQFLVKWFNYPREDNTWMDAHSFK